MGGYTRFTGDGPPDPPDQQEDEQVNEPNNSCGEPARKGQFGPLDEAREQLAAKDREIAELRACITDLRAVCHESAGKILEHRLAAQQTEAERDEARECVGRLYSAAIDVVAVADRATLIFDTMKAALAGTPEHLRGQ